MKTYLFVDRHYYHDTTYHPFRCDIELSNEQAEKLQRARYPEADRVGTSFQDFLRIIEDMGFEIHYYFHPEYGVKVYNVLKPNLAKWNVIKGISGSY